MTKRLIALRSERLNRWRGLEVACLFAWLALACASTGCTAAATGGMDAGGTDAGETDAGSPDAGEAPECVVSADCHNPIAAICADEFTLRTSSSAGTCVAGACEFQPVDTLCANGCDQRACDGADPCIAGACALPRDAGPAPDAGPGADSGVAPDSGLPPDAGPGRAFFGAFETSEAGCFPCRSVNPATGACDCPAGSAATNLGVINDCAGGGTQHGAQATVCAAPVRDANAAFQGAYQRDDESNCGNGPAVCRSPNPFTGSCTCPAGSSAIVMRAVANVPAVPVCTWKFVGTQIGFCFKSSATPSPNFGGAYQRDDDGTCRTPNPATSACSCPAGTIANALRVEVPQGTSFRGSRISVCGEDSFDRQICPGSPTVDISGAGSAVAAIQYCIANPPPTKEIELPPGFYTLDGPIFLHGPVLKGFRTRGTPNSAARCLKPGVRCAVLRAASNYDSTNPSDGFVRLSNTSVANILEGFTFDHIVLDGNRTARLAAANPTLSSNLTGSCSSCTFTNSAFLNAVKFTAFSVDMTARTTTGAGGVVRNNLFSGNGQHIPDPVLGKLWADGITFRHAPGVLVELNEFRDNTDIDLVLGDAPAAIVRNNTFIHSGSDQGASFAALMLDNFGHGAPTFTGTSGDFRGAVISGNTINCANRCDFGIEVGPGPWYGAAADFILGGTVTGNTVSGARYNLDVFRAGTAAAPVTVFGNTLGSFLRAPFTRCAASGTFGARFNIAPTTPKSVVDRKGETNPASANEVPPCE